MADDPKRVVPRPEPKPVPPAVRRDLVDEAEAYLKERGWELAGRSERGESLWADPAGAGPKSGEMVKAGDLPVKDKDSGRISSQPLMQLCVPPVPWEYTLMDALHAQHQRDAGKGETTADRLNRLGAEHDRLRRAHNDLIVIVNNFLTKPMAKETVAGFKLQQVKLAEALAAAKLAVDAEAVKKTA